ncbi:MAG TPA: adenine deaminase C-terminal domain-containing protein [Trueperaceae bacterium]|nr:adenine deaminase C-terminal domain-containing protein [Trueperaceae bacterium]
MKPFAPSLTARDLLVKNAMLVDVVTQSSYRGWFTVQGGRFVEVEAGDPTPADLAGLSIAKQRDLGGAWVQPGMLDVHMHIESSLVTPRRFAEAALPHGTTTVLQDPHEVANVAGAAGIRWMLEASRGLPQRMFTAISSCVPATSADIETPNASITPAEVSELARAPEVIALGEVMDYQGLVAGAMVAAASAAGLSIEGHVPSLSGTALSRYVANGVRSDHTLASPAKLLEELRKGLWVMLQEKSLTLEVVQTVAALPDRSRILLITDDVMPDRLLTGHVSRLVDLAVDLGWPVLDAIASATVRPASYLGMHDLGLLAPGALADFVVTDDLAAFPPREVHVAGKLVAEGGETVVPSVSASSLESAAVGRPTFVPGNVSAEALRFSGQAGAHSVLARVIAVNLINSFTTLSERQVDLLDGLPVDPDIALACVVPRAALQPGAGSYEPAVCLVAGTGLHRGAYASSFAHDSHNVFLFWRDPLALARSLAALAGAGGGMAFTDGEETTLLPLPLAGLLSDEPVGVVGAQFAALEAALRGAGMHVKAPILLLTLLPLSVSPDFKVTDKGIVDVQARRILAPTVAS